MKDLLSELKIDLCLSNESDASNDSLPWNWSLYTDSWISKISSNYAVVFIDSYHIRISQIKALNQLTKIILIDDFRRSYLGVGLIIDWTFNSERIWKNLYPSMNFDNGTFYLGEEYAVVRKEFLRNDAIYPVERDVLTIFGGSDIANYTAFFSLLLNNSDLAYEHVITPQYPCFATHKNRSNVIIEASADELNHLFRSSGLVISCGGQTLYELAVCNAKVALVAAAENQMDDIENFLQIHGGIQMDKNMCLETVASLIQSDFWKRRSLSLNKKPVVGRRVSELQKGIYNYVGW